MDEQDPAQEEQSPSTVFEQLAAALSRAAAAARALAAAGDDADALGGIVALDGALEQLPGLERATEGLLAVALAGADVEEHLSRRAAETAAMVVDIAALREAVDRAREREGEFRARVEERAELRSRLVELRRLERLATVLGELEGQRQLIDDRLAVLAQPVGTAEAAIERGSSDLLRLTDERREALRPKAREALERVAAAQAELAAAESALGEHEAELAEVTRRRAELQDLHRERLATLRIHAEADRRLASGFGRPGADGQGVELAVAAVDDVQARLDEIDMMLGEVLVEREAGAPRPILSWRG